MSQFKGFTLELTLNDAKNTTLKGTITKIVEKTLTVSNVDYLDGSNIHKDEIKLNGSEIADLKVIEVPEQSKGKSKKDKQKQKKGKEKSKEKLKDKIESSPAPAEQYRAETPTSQKQKKRSNNRQQTATPQDPDMPYNYRDNDIDWDADSVDKIKLAEEFDFESNLQKFDKSSVFKELSNNDKISPYNRLVGHNKLPEKTKYGIDEMVISTKEDQWDSIDHTDESDSNNVSEEQLKKQQEEATLLSFIKKNAPSTSSSTGTTTPLKSALTPADIIPKRVASPLANNISFKSSADGEIVHYCSPIQMMEIETLALEKFGLTSQIMNENAGREISALIIGILVGKTARISSSNHNAPPLVLVLAGNNKAGARALAAGRILSNHGIRVITFLLHDENSEDDLLSEVTLQLNILNAVGGKTVTSVKQLQNLLSKIDYPLEFILDGLQGYNTNLADLIDTELQNAVSILTWCNSANVLAMSLDIPSGLDPGTGQLSDEQIPILNSKWVVSQGLPISSIANAYKLGVVSKGDWNHHLIDLSIPLKVFATKSNLKRFNRQIFSDSWSIALEVV